jgi:hypothetical protein
MSYELSFPEPEYDDLGSSIVCVLQQVAWYYECDLMSYDTM